jgi:quercetin dioxygenase-like cupin family protein
MYGHALIMNVEMMRPVLIVLGLTAAVQPREAPRVVIDNARVRVYRTTVGALRAVRHGPGVVVSIDSGPDEGTAVWLEDVAGNSASLHMRGAIAVVQPLATRAAPPPPAATRPGEAPFTGMSFKPMFENDRVSVIRARMEVGAREDFHTHGSDTIVVHLSGGEIEDTANGKTVVNRWKRGDVEFEAIGSSHSARNLGAAVDVVLVALKRPQGSRSGLNIES